MTFTDRDSYIGSVIIEHVLYMKEDAEGKKPTKRDINQRSCLDICRFLHVLHISY